jgi:adenylylsulfate kinase
MTGRILWFTGLSGSGKTTLALRLEQILRETGYPVEVLDGDQARTTICRDLGFSEKDRLENIRRLGFVARMLAHHGVTVIVATITPYGSQRQEQEDLAAADEIEFFQIYTCSDMETLVRRDTKGLYKRAYAGDIDNFTGVSAPYEPPEHPRIFLQTDKESVEESVSRILVTLVEADLR